MSTEDLIACAEYLINRPESERTQVDINRASSTLYYALFHELASTCATFIMGPKPTGHGRRAWQQVYRALEHKRSSSKCKNKSILGKFPAQIINFGNFYVSLQEKRHQSDYDPLLSIGVTDVEFDIKTAKGIIEELRTASEIDLRAFCAFVLFENREDPARKAEEDRKQKEAAAERVRQQKANQKTNPA